MENKTHIFKINENYTPCDIDSSILLKIYQNMLLTRAFDKKAIALQRTGKLGTFPACYGQEAIYSSIAVAMAKEDILCPYYRDHGALIYRGISISSILKYWGGYDYDAASSTNMPICVPIASQCLHAAGIAYSLKYKKFPRAVVVTIGDGGTSKGDFYEAMNFAGVHNLPIVFVINNNAWAISTPLELQTKCETLAQKAIAAGIEGITVNGNDATILYQTLKYALGKAYSSGGPTVIDAKTYRLCDHTTADDKLRYSQAEEISKAAENEPIAKLAEHLKDILDEATTQKINHDIETLIDQETQKYLEYRQE